MSQRREPTRPTRGEVILRALRNDILNGYLLPGSPLGFADLGARYQASTGVLREVLPRLVEQGLVTVVPQIGYRVVEVSVQDLVHLTEARAAIETQVLAQSIRDGDLDWESSVVAAHHRLSQLSTIRDDGEINTDWLHAHRRFHQVLLEGCPNLRLREVAERLRDISEVYRCWSVRNTEQLQQRDAEHARLAALALERDVEGAKKELTDHIHRTTEVLLAAQKDATRTTS
ncbi:GntR family transcriptional regulator [Nonomuraea wenchangensis]|uniref:GntR family transcriptional regulator n=1 Tax=Nonomuraea wenchangensis TaxID=568860 RepID=UPI00341ED1E9